MSEPATVDAAGETEPVVYGCVNNGHPPVVKVRQPGAEAPTELRCKCGKYVWERMPSLG